jgi:hypothetical protein
MEHLDRFHPVFRHALGLILGELRSLGWQPRIASGMRITAEQAEKVRHGYSKTMRSWHVASTVGMLPVSRASFVEVNGNAADIVDSRYGWEGPAADKSSKFWRELGRVAKKYGCYWGGDWKMKDVAHIYMLFSQRAPQRTGLASRVRSSIPTSQNVAQIDSPLKTAVLLGVESVLPNSYNPCCWG